MIGPSGKPAGPATVVGKDAVFVGELECGSDARIEGRLEGRIAADGRVEVAASGSVKADVEAASVVVHGKLEGNVRARERASLGSGCRVTGAVTAARLKVEEGARLELRVDAGGKVPPPGQKVREKLAAELTTTPSRLPT